MRSPTRAALPAGIVVGGLAALVAAWMGGSALHEHENADSLVLALVSLQRWTPFYWEQNRFGMLVPLLAMPVRHPLANVMVQGWISSTTALLTPFIVVRALWGTSVDWIGAGSVANALLVVFAPLAVQFDWLVTQPYALSITLAFAAIIVLERPGLRRSAVGTALLILAHWVNVGVWLLALPAVLFRRRLNGRVCVAVATGIAAGLGFSALSRAPHTSSGFAPLAAWPGGWLALATGARAALQHRAWLGIILAAVLIATLVDTRRRADAIRIFASASALAVAYWLAVGSSRWVLLNLYQPRYVYPSLFLAGVALSVLIMPMLGTSRRYLSLVAFVGAVAIAYGLPSESRVRRHFDESFGRLTPEVLDSGARVIAGDYWTVWPSVFHANLALYRHHRDRSAACQIDRVYGLTYRSVETDRLWCHADGVRVAARSGDRAIGVYADRITLPLTFLEHRTSVDLFTAGPCAGE